MTDKTGPVIAVAIVNYGTPDLTIDCLHSLATEIPEYPGSFVVVADNASTDDSVGRISTAIEANGWQDWVSLEVQSRNGGFAYGNNAIIRGLADRPRAPEFVWLLNSDTVARPGALRELVSFLEHHSKVGAAGSCLEDPDGTQQCSIFRFHSIASEFEASVKLGLVTRFLARSAVMLPVNRNERTCDWVSGASMMIRAEVLHQVGLMDENYFLYFEETDYCQRVIAGGWSIWFVPTSRVVHLVGKSSGVTARDRVTARRSSYWFQSRRTYFTKHHGRAYAAAADLALATGTILHQIRSLVTRKKSNIPESFVIDLAQHSVLWQLMRRRPLQR